MTTPSNKLEIQLQELEHEILNFKNHFNLVIKKMNLVKKQVKKINNNKIKKNKKDKKDNSNNFNEPILHKFNKEISNILNLEQNKEILFSEFNNKLNQYIINNNLINNNNLEEDNNKINIVNINDDFKNILKETRSYKINNLTLNNIHLYLKHNYSIKKK
jgi:hypothetical protein